LAGVLAGESPAGDDVAAGGVAAVVEAVTCDVVAVSAPPQEARMPTAISGRARRFTSNNRIGGRRIVDVALHLVSESFRIGAVSLVGR
jgi:hypothetical protein